MAEDPLAEVIRGAFPYDPAATDRLLRALDALDVYRAVRSHIADNYVGKAYIAAVFDAEEAKWNWPGDDVECVHQALTDLRAALLGTTEEAIGG